jgi:redox-sensitive bicupin YhaK (pirin superfamily)
LMEDITRRELIKILAAGAAGASLISCSTPSPKDNAVSPKPVEELFSGNPILGIRQLPASGPWPTQDPFLFCVHHNDRYPSGNPEGGPNANLAGRELGQDFADIDGWNMYHGQTVPGFPRHPHRGFETVTVIQEGVVDHADSLGGAARYGAGDVQWLTAGHGINHAEMFPLLRQDAPNPVDFFQIWLNLPAKNKMAEPHFAMLWNKDIPKIKHRDVAGNETTIKIVAGQYGDTKGPTPPPKSWAAQAETQVGIWTIDLAPNASWTLPHTHADSLRALYLVDGNPVNIAGQDLDKKIQISLHPGAKVVIKNSNQQNRLLLLQGLPINEPVVQHGPFVMNSREEIIEAFDDYRATQFGGWPWKGSDPTHGQSAQRFAKHPDNSKEEPI